MFQKLKRIFADDINSAEKDVGMTIASMLYDIARVEGLDVLHQGQVFLVYWFKRKKGETAWRKGGLDVSFGAPSPRLKDNGVDYCKSFEIKRNLKSLFTSIAIEGAKKQGAEEFSNMCTFAVLTNLNDLRKANFQAPFTVFKIPRQQPAAFASSRSYRNAVLADDESERARLVRDATEGRTRPQIFIQPMITVGHARSIEWHLNDSDSDFEYITHYEGFIR